MQQEKLCVIKMINLEEKNISPKKVNKDEISIDSIN